MARDSTLLIATRSLRGFSTGLLAVLIGPYLAGLGYGPGSVGLLVALPIAGGAAWTLLALLKADAFGRRRMLALFSLLGAASALGLLLTPEPAVLVLALLAGGLALSGADAAAFIPVEQALLPQTVPPERRNRLFGSYAMAGTLSIALGALAAGAGEALRAGPGERVLFLLPAALNLAAFGLYLALSPSVERAGAARSLRTDPESRGRVARLGLLFSLDSFAGGFVLYSLVAYWFHHRFGWDLAALGPLLFAVNALVALSFPLAARLGDRFGLVNTMVFTHLPSDFLLMAVPFMPTAEASAALWLVRAPLSQMDVPTRQAYTVAIVPPEERTAAAGLTHLARTAAQAPAPWVSGWSLSLAASAPFLFGGGLKVAYDLMLYRSFRRVRPLEGRG
jgi:MFS family permease